MPASRARLVLGVTSPSIRAAAPKRPKRALPSPSAHPGLAMANAPPAVTRSTLFFRSLNLPNYNRVTPQQLETHLLDFLASQTPPMLDASCWSYLVTGNVVVSVPTPAPSTSASTEPSLVHDPGFSITDLEQALIPKGLATQVFLRTSSALQHILLHCPFDLNSTGSKVHVVFLERRPEAAAVDALKAKVELAGESVWWSADGADDREEMGKEVVLWYPLGQAKAKNQLPQVERLLGMKGSQRGFSIVRACAQAMLR